MSEPNRIHKPDNTASNGGESSLGKGLERALERLKAVDEHLRKADEHVSRARDAERAAGAH
jgi:hypothetical protein